MVFLDPPYFFTVDKGIMQVVHVATVTFELMTSNVTSQQDAVHASMESWYLFLVMYSDLR